MALHIPTIVYLLMYVLLYKKTAEQYQFIIL